jgi:hypothetical protein
MYSGCRKFAEEKNNRSRSHFITRNTRTIREKTRKINFAMFRVIFASFALKIPLNYQTSKNAKSAEEKKLTAIATGKSAEARKLTAIATGKSAEARKLTASAAGRVAEM